MRKVESINFRFGGRSTSFCSSDLRLLDDVIFTQYLLCLGKLHVELSETLEFQTVLPRQSRFGLGENRAAVAEVMEEST